MTAILVLTASVLFATAVLLMQCLQRWSWHWLISWFWRIKPILDAYGTFQGQILLLDQNVPSSSDISLPRLCSKYTG